MVEASAYFEDVCSRYPPFVTTADVEMMRKSSIMKDTNHFAKKKTKVSFQPYSDLIESCKQIS